MKTLVFAVAGYNFADTGRMIEIAKAAQMVSSLGCSHKSLWRETTFTINYFSAGG